jgi:effector-binding domain-containing protein
MEQGMAAGYNRLEELLSSHDGRTKMIDTPQITQTTAQLAAVIHLTIPRSEIRSAMGPGLTEVMAAVKAQGIGPAGPWFTHHLKMNPATFDFEICVPVTAPVAPVGRVKPGILPAVTVARTSYHGDYEGLGEAWGEFKAWIAANGHSAGPDLYECYPVGPESSPNPADWCTELSQPLIA